MSSQRTAFCFELKNIFISQKAVNVTVVVTPLETAAVLLWLVCPVSATVTVYVPTGIQFVVKIPVEPVVPVTVVAITPPLIVTVAPDTATLLELSTFAEIFPAVAIEMLSVEVVPLVTLTDSVLGRYPLALAVTFTVPAVTLVSV